MVSSSVALPRLIALEFCTTNREKFLLGKLCKESLEKDSSNVQCSAWGPSSVHTVGSPMMGLAVICLVQCRLMNCVVPTLCTFSRRSMLRLSM